VLHVRGEAAILAAGTQFTCFTSTKGQRLTAEELRAAMKLVLRRGVETALAEVSSISSV
jgi:hypothetical protein